MSPAGAVRADPSFDRYARMVCRALDVPVALVSLVEPDRQVLTGACGLPPEVDAERQTPLSHSFCQHVVADRAPLVVDDARTHPRVRDNPAIRDLAVIAYAGWPITDHTGTVVGSLCAIAHEPRSWSDGDLEMLADLAAACSTELSERAMRSAEQDLSYRSRVLLALSEALSSTRDLADVARAVEQTALVHLGCLRAGIWLRAGGERGEVLSYVDYPGAGWASAHNNRVLPLDETNPLGSAIVRRHPLHFGDKDLQNRLYPHLDTSQQVGDARSFVPLVSRDRVLGTLALLWETDRRLSDEDRVTIEALTSYAAQALQRALLVQERLDALVTLQNSLLPRLPEPADLELAARYRPAASRDQVGGDWYDAVVMPSGLTCLMVGDVVGHDIGAAAIMGQLRTMLRAIAWAVDDAPSRNVTRLDQAMQDLTVDGMASLVYARIEQSAQQRTTGERTLRWTNAGHPPPLVVTAGGTVTLLADGVPDLMLGVDPDGERDDRRTTIASGSLLLLYTDGLVERRGEDIDDGLHRLASVAGRHHGLPVGEFLDAVLAELAPERLDDDVAVLAVRFHDQHPG